MVFMSVCDQNLAACCAKLAVLDQHLLLFSDFKFSFIKVQWPFMRIWRQNQ